MDDFYAAAYALRWIIAAIVVIVIIALLLAD